MFHLLYFHELSMAQDTLTTVEKVIRSTTIALLEDRTKGVSMPGCQVRNVAAVYCSSLFMKSLLTLPIGPTGSILFEIPELVEALFYH